MRKVLVAGDEAQPSTTQHTSPCSDCPWRRDALPGWLGGRTPESYQAAAHGEEQIFCHVHIGPQCAGAAIYRANVLKSPRDPDVLRLPADKARVFGIGEFLRHHKGNE